MTLKTTPFDAAQYLKDEASIAAFIEACQEDNDPALMVHALGAVARARNMSQLARETGISREGLYKAFSGEGNPSFDTVAKVANALGFQIALRPITAVGELKKEPAKRKKNTARSASASA